MKSSLSLIKNLRGRIKDVEKDRDYWEDNYREQKVETGKKEEIIKNFKELRNGLINGLEVNFQGEINRLQQIIKWLIKPSTTEEKRPEDFPRRFRDDIRP